MPADTQRLAQLNRDGLISDRDLYLGKDAFTVVEKGSAEAHYLLAPEDTLIPTDQVTRLGLAIAGGKIVQNKEAAKGGPEAGQTPQSASEPPSKPVMEAGPVAVTMSGFEAKEEVKPVPVSGPELDPRTGAPKSDPRFHGSSPPREEARAVPPKAEEKAVREQQEEQEAEAIRVRKTAKAQPAKRSR